MAAACEYEEVTGTLQFSVLPVLDELCVFSRENSAGVYVPADCASHPETRDRGYV